MLKIKQQKEFELFYAEEGAPPEELIRSSDFNEDGKVTREIGYQEGQPIVEKKISYYPDGNIHEVRIEYLEMDTFESWVHEYEEAKLIIIKQYFSEELTAIASYHYNADDKIIEEIDQDADGLILRHLVIDHEKHLRKEQIFNEEGTLWSLKESQINAAGLPIIEVEQDFSPYGLARQEKRFTYDDNGNLINLKIFEDGENTLNEDYFFNEANVEIKSVGFDEDTQDTIKILREVNAQNQVVKEEQYANEILTHSFEKEFDEHHQLIAKKVWTSEGNYGTEELDEFRYENEYY